MLKKVTEYSAFCNSTFTVHIYIKLNYRKYMLTFCNVYWYINPCTVQMQDICLTIS